MVTMLRDHAAGATNGSHLADGLADHIGGSVRLAQDGVGYLARRGMVRSRDVAAPTLLRELRSDLSCCPDRLHRARTVKEFLESIREAGVALVEDRRIPRGDLEAAMPRALANLLQVYSLVYGPADPV
jgi:hypothetical protein